MRGVIIAQFHRLTVRQRNGLLIMLAVVLGILSDYVRVLIWFAVVVIGVLLVSLLVRQHRGETESSSEHPSAGT
jgi:hypothetical protein